MPHRTYSAIPPQNIRNTAAAILQYLTADILQYPSFVAC
jgi:hypothetical protein